MQGASQKKATEQQVGKMAKGLMMNHNKVAGGVALPDAARSLLSGGAGLEGSVASLTNVEALLPDDVDCNMEEAAEEAAEGEADDAEAEAKPMRTKWFDRDRSLNKVHKQMVAMYEKTRTSASEELKKMVEQEKEAKSLSSQGRKSIATDLAVLQPRQKFLEALFEPGDDRLKSLIAGVQAAGGSQASSKGDPLALLGKSGPCRLYKDLVTFSSWLDCIDKILQAEDADALESAKKACSDLKAPIADLLSAAKNAVTDLGRALKAVKSAKPTSDDMKKRRKAGSGTADASKTVFDLASSMEAVAVLGEGATDFDVSKPLLIECSTHKVHNFEADGAIKQEVLTNFVQIFLAQAPAQKMDRGAKRFPAGSDVHVKLTKRMVEILPCTDIPETAPEALRQAMAAQVTIVAKNSFRVLTEKHQSGPCWHAMSF